MRSTSTPAVGRSQEAPRVVCRSTSSIAHRVLDWCDRSGRFPTCRVGPQHTPPTIQRGRVRQSPTSATGAPQPTTSASPTAASSSATANRAPPDSTATRGAHPWYGCWVAYPDGNNTPLRPRRPHHRMRLVNDANPQHDDRDPARPPPRGRPNHRDPPRAREPVRTTPCASCAFRFLP